MEKIVKTEKIEKLQKVEKTKVAEKVIPVSKKILTSPSSKVDVKKEYLKQHLALIRKYIMQNVKYPKRAKRMHIQDVVRVKFTLLQSGKITNIKILSGNKHLQKSTIQALEKASSSFPKVSKNIDIIVPIEYKLI